ncbi:probable cytochrome P450 49a1, partial [Ctenocephalides felis]
MSVNAASRTSSKVLRVSKSFSSAITITPDELTGIIHGQDKKVEETTRTYPKAYEEIPGPKELPLIGNAWRFAPFIGQYKIHELDKVMMSLHKDFGNVVRVGGLVGHPDLLFVFDGEEIRRVFRREETLPHRPSMPSLHHYKAVLRKDFFGKDAGIIGVHGEKWDAFRAQVQQLMLQPATAKRFVGPLDEIAGDFMQRIHEMRDGNQELPGNFLGELYKWALESIGRVALDTRLGCLSRDLEPNSEPQRIISAINTFFWNVAEVELRVPLWRIYPTKSYRKYIGALDEFRELCMKYISIAMENMDKSNASGNYSIVQKILNETSNPKLAAVLALDLLLVGVDTTSVAMTTTIYQLSQNQEKQRRLRDELKSILPTPGTPIDVQALEKMQYLKACIKEALRMKPVILGNGRSLQSEAVVGGYKVPKG